MEINSMRAFNDPNSEYTYLDSSELVEGNRYKRLALVLNVNYGNDKFDMGYFSFYLKTADGMILSAPLFNVNNFIEKGFVANSLTGKPVVVEFMAQIYRGRWSLILTSINLWEGAFDRTKFVSELDVSTDTIEKALSICDSRVSVSLDLWKIASFEELAGGTIGAFAQLARMLFLNLESFRNMWGIDIESLFSTAAIALNVQYKVYKLKEKYPKVRDEMALDILNDLRIKWDGDVKKDAILNIASSILFDTQPDHLYASLIKDTLDNALNNIKMLYLYKSVPTGGMLEYGHRKLVKY